MKSMVLFLLMASLSAFASQAPTKSNVTVRVTDRSGNPMDGVTVKITSKDGAEYIPKRGTNEGDYLVEVPYGDYVVDTALTGFHRVSRALRVDEDRTWLAISPSFIDYSEPNYSRTSLSGKVTFRRGEAGPYWIRFVSLYGSEMVEAPINENGNYRAILDGNGRYVIWVVGYGRVCTVRTENFGGRGPTTLNIDVPELCRTQ